MNETTPVSFRPAHVDADFRNRMRMSIDIETGPLGDRAALVAALECFTRDEIFEALDSYARRQLSREQTVRGS